MENFDNIDYSKYKNFFHSDNSKVDTHQEDSNKGSEEFQDEYVNDLSTYQKPNDGNYEPSQKPDDPDSNHFNPDGHDSELELTKTTTIERQPRQHAMAVTIDGRVMDVDDPTPPIFREEQGVVASVVSRPPFDNKDSSPLPDVEIDMENSNPFLPSYTGEMPNKDTFDLEKENALNPQQEDQNKDYYEKLRELLEVYQKYSDLLQYFNKDDIKEVLKDAQKYGIENHVDTDNLDNFETPKL